MKKLFGKSSKDEEKERARLQAQEEERRRREREEEERRRREYEEYVRREKERNLIDFSPERKKF